MTNPVTSPVTGQVTGPATGSATGSASGPVAGGLDHRPGPGGVPRRRAVVAHAAIETRLLVRNPEQLLVAVVIPLLALVVLDRTALLDGSLAAGQSRISLALPGVLALATLSTAFTSTAITTGFDRRYGVLRRLGATPLRRSGLVGGKVLAVLVVLAGQVLVLVVAGVLLGWRPATATGLGWAVVLLGIGVAALVPLALLVGGTLRAEASLAVANIVYVLLLGFSAVLVPAGRYPGPIAGLARALPSGALAQGLRSVMTGGRLPIGSVVVLLVWAVVAGMLSARFFRWD